MRHSALPHASADAPAAGVAAAAFFLDIAVPGGLQASPRTLSCCLLVLRAREQSAVVHNGRLSEGGRQAGARTRARRARCARQPQRVGRKAQAACHSCETRLQGVTRRRRAQPARTHYTQAAAVPRGAGRRPPSSPRTRRTRASKLLLRRARPSRAPARARSWPARLRANLSARSLRGCGQADGPRSVVSSSKTLQSPWRV